MEMVDVNLVVEGLLDERVLRRLIGQTDCHFNAGPCYGQNGKDNLWQNVPRYNIAARQVPFIILADLDREECPMALIERWLPGGAMVI